MAGNIWGIAAAVAGVLAGLAVIARGRRMLLVDPAAILTQSHTG
jgi:hypothetical protein